MVNAAAQSASGKSVMARVALGVVIAMIAWGTFAFGAVYAWAYWPLIAAAFAVALLSVATSGTAPSTTLDLWLAVAFAAFGVAAAVQLLPLQLDTLRDLAPETVRALGQINPAVASGAVRRHGLSIAPQDTVVGIWLFAACAIVALATSKLFTLRGARGFARALAILGALVALVGIVQQPLFNGRIYGFWTTIDGGSPYGPFVNRNHFAGWMLMTLPVTLGLLLGGITRAMRGVRPDWRDRLVWFSSAEASHLILIGAAAVVMALALVLTMSRSGVASLVVSMAITGAFVGRRRWTGGRAGVAFAYLLFLIVVVSGWVGADAIASRFSDTNWADVNARRGAWADAADIRARFPFAGTGLNTYGVATILYQRHDTSRRYTEAHNDYLQLAAEGGWLLTLPAIACVLAFTVAVKRRFVEETSASAYWLRVGAITGIAAIAIQETVEFSLQMPGNAVLFAALCGIALHKAPVRRTL